MKHRRPIQRIATHMTIAPFPISLPTSVSESITEPTSEPIPEAFQEYDITLMALGDNLIHMGVVYTGKQLGFFGFPYFNSPTEVGEAIASAGFNVVLHATNQTADQGIDGLKNYVSFWEEQYPGGKT